MHRFPPRVIKKRTKRPRKPDLPTPNESWMKVHRMRLGYTQMQVAQYFGFSSPQFISNIERGMAYLPMEHLDKAAEVFQMTRREVFDLICKEIIDALKKRYL